MQIPLFKCDLCKHEHRPGRAWWDNANGGIFSVCKDGINGRIEWNNLCPTCRESLCNAVEKVIEVRQKIGV